MSFWGSFRQTLPQESEEPQKDLPEMSETPFRRGTIQALLLDEKEGSDMNVAKVWESILNPGSRRDEAIVPSIPQSKAGSTWENEEQDGLDAGDMLSQYAEEGSEEYAAKALSPLPIMDDNSCWHSLEFGANTFGKIGNKATLERSWYGINWFDKRTIVLRSAVTTRDSNLGLHVGIGQRCELD